MADVRNWQRSMMILKSREERKFISVEHNNNKDCISQRDKDVWDLIQKIQINYRCAYCVQLQHVQLKFNTV